MGDLVGETPDTDADLLGDPPEPPVEWTKAVAPTPMPTLPDFGGDTPRPGLGGVKHIMLATSAADMTSCSNESSVSQYSEERVRC